MNERQQIALLLHKYLEGALGEEEAGVLEEWKEKSAANRRFFEGLQDEDQLSRWIAEDHPEKVLASEERIYKRIVQQIPELRTVSLYRRAWFRVAVAASLLFIVGITAWLMLYHKPEKTEIVRTEPVKDVEAPKTTKATIILGNGHAVSVDSLSLITQSSVQLSRTADGKIVYSGNASEIVYNTLSNPKGSKVVNMTLSDGSTVWLNSGSSITYPVAFMGNERNVTISGEAYFEVSHNARMPFSVTKGSIRVQVLGTHFNINAYDDEPDVKVTLLEGAVKVKNETAEGLLKPGQQAQVAAGIKVLNDVNIDEVMAWKNGRFTFNNASLKEVMRQLARWYDLDIEYKGTGGSEREFWGTIPKSNSLLEVLQTLETNNIHFEIEGKKMIITLTE